MGIKLVEEKRHHLGFPDITRPMFVCDHCGEEIEHHSHGYYLWHSRIDEEEFYDVPMDFYIVHAGPEYWRGCWSALVKEKFGDELVLDMSLTNLLGYMQNVLHYDAEKEQKRLYG